MALPSGADPRTERQRKGTAPRTGTVKNGKVKFPSRGFLPGLGSLVLLPGPGVLLSVCLPSFWAAGLVLLGRSCPGSLVFPCRFSRSRATSQ